MIVLCEQYHPDWHAEAQKTGETGWKAKPIIRTNRVMRGVWLREPGEYEIRYTFRSRAFEIGSYVSGTLWAIVLIGWAIKRLLRAVSLLPSSVRRD